MRSVTYTWKDVYMKKITHYELAERFNEINLKAATKEKSISAFKPAGIFSLNP
jgi:hypothetical protein